jgi:pimeloyl-ACP methyl ester carboxylesterase
MRKPFSILFWAMVLACALLPRGVQAEKAVKLRNGFVLRGTATQIPGLDQNSFAAAGKANDGTGLPVLMVDDGLKRSYVHGRSMVDSASDVADLVRRIPFWQPIARSGNDVASLSASTSVEPFNEFGRRYVYTNTPRGAIQILQGMTEINARYAELRGLQTKISYNWDSRISSDSLSEEELKRIFLKGIARDDLDGRLDVVNFYIESERFKEARNELTEVIRDFPAADQLPAQFQALTQREARNILDEALVRRDAGQYQLALTMLNNFVQVDGIAKVTLLEAQDRIDELTKRATNAKSMLARLREQIASLRPGQETGLADFVNIMEAELTFDTMNRLSDYERLGADEGLPLENRVALAIGGWLLGGGSGVQNLAVVRSLVIVRQLVSEYLGDADALRREAILKILEDEEGAQPEYVAKLLATLPPPVALPEPEQPAVEPAAAEPKVESPPGYYEITIDTVRGPVTYSIQLPPEYHPLRRYPTIVALHPIGASGVAEIAWWCGGYNPQLQMRTGQAARQGYIVVAPVWARPGQPSYEHTPIEHHRVLAALRDAMRRVSIDSDRVYLSGHLAGGSAAWDIALAHPDLWAGLINIGGDAARYVLHYGANAKYVPIYYLTGEMAGAPSPLFRNGAQLDDYMKPGFDAMVVLYRGRGDELFYEDIHNIFDWLRLSSHRRPAIPKDIQAATMREGDQFFWWLELSQLLDTVAVNPVLFEHAERLRAGQIDAKVMEANAIQISQAPSNTLDILLTPEMGLDLNKPVTVRSGGRRKNYQFEGSIAYMLEDARQRADRQHVFWAKVSLP